MAIATLTTRGRVTLPKELRVAANLQPGDRIQFTVLADGTIIVRPKKNGIRDLPVMPTGSKRFSGEGKNG